MKTLFAWLRVCAVAAFGVFVVWLVTGCAHAGDEFRPKHPPRACDVVISVDRVPKHCLTTDEVRTLRGSF